MKNETANKAWCILYGCFKKFAATIGDDYIDFEKEATTRNTLKWLGKHLLRIVYTCDNIAAGMGI